MAEEERVDNASETEQQEERSTPRTKWKVNPADLPPELRAIYAKMQADYTRKTQQLAEERKKMEAEVSQLRSQLEELQRQLRGYETYMLNALGLQGQSAQPSAGTETSYAYQQGVPSYANGEARAPELNPWDPESVRQFVHSILQERERYYQEVANRLVQDLVNLTLRNSHTAIQVARLLSRDPSVADHLDTLAQEAVAKYNGDLNKAYEEWSKGMKERQLLQSKVRELEQKLAKVPGQPVAPAPPVLPQQTLTASLRRAGDTGRYATILQQVIGGGTSQGQGPTGQGPAGPNQTGG
jgi:hypothetical protein